MNKDEDNLCTTDLNSIAEFNRIILNYKKMETIIQEASKTPVTTFEYQDSAGRHYFNYKDAKPIMQGWQCPVCGKVYSPYVTQCENEFCGVKVTTGNLADI